jgi:EAL domain-containing protein (putative c-di-GMP-specific phosphodiesterase class I)
MIENSAAADGESPGPENPVITAATIRAVLADPESVAISFQPILDVQGNRTAGWEILTRFTRRPDVPTDRWFAAAYELGLGTPLEAYVLSRVLPAWRLRSPGTFMTFNITPAALGDPTIERLVAAQAPLHGLVIELTEQLSPHGRQRCWQAACERLRAEGAMIAIDDLGTGYSELAEILALRPDIIKLDRSVVATVDRDPAQQALVRFLGDFCGHLDAWVLAEGVERQGQLEVLRDLGVPLAQGWLTGRPAPVPRPCPAQLTRESNTTPRRPGTVATLVRAVSLTWEGRPDRHEPSIRLDDQGRPVHVTLPSSDGEPAATTPATLLVAPDLPLVETARRAMARSMPGRFDPLVCIDGTGHVLGLVAVQDLVLALADARSAGRAGTSARPLGGRRPGRRRGHHPG